MQNAQVTAAVRASGGWSSRAATEPARVYLHGLGASSGPYFAASAVHPLLAGQPFAAHGHARLRHQRPAHGLRLHARGARRRDRRRAPGRRCERDRRRRAQHGRLGGHRARGPPPGAGGAARPGRRQPRPGRTGPRSGPAAAASPRTRRRSSWPAAWSEVRDRVGPHWWSTMRLGGPRGAAPQCGAPGARDDARRCASMLLELKIPRTYLRPEADGPLPGEDALVEGGVRVVRGPGVRAQHHAGQPRGVREGDGPGPGARLTGACVRAPASASDCGCDGDNGEHQYEHNGHDAVSGLRVHPSSVTAPLSAPAARRPPSRTAAAPPAPRRPADCCVRERPRRPPTVRPRRRPGPPRRGAGPVSERLRARVRCGV